jgi:putative ABC transport system permease protein
MRNDDLARLARESLERHRVRTVLTLAAVAIGVLAVLALAGVGTAAKRYVLDQFAGMGTCLITVSPGRTESSGLGSGMGLASARPLTLDDAEAVRRRVPQALHVAPLSLGTAAVEYGSLRRDVYLVGATSVFAGMRDLGTSSGSFLPSPDAANREHVVVLGAKLAHELFGESQPVGRAVRVANARFRVIGVLRSKGTSLGLDFDDMALVPAGAGMALLNQANLHHIIVQAVSPAALPQVREDVRATLTDRHREEDFTLVTQDAMLATVRNVLDALTLSLAGIAAISLGVAGVGIMNVMLVSVSERIGEIGLLKSLGGRPGDIRALFLTEAAALSGLGAMLGVALDLVAIAVARRVLPSFPIAPDPMWIAGTTLFALATGVLFGWLPARRAARLPAAEALRGRV